MKSFDSRAKFISIFDVSYPACPHHGAMRFLTIYVAFSEEGVGDTGGVNLHGAFRAILVA